MNTRNRCFLAVTVLIPAMAVAASIQGPQLGFVFDSSRGTLRPILGIPGAALLGNPLPTQVELKTAVISPLGDYALATGGENNQVMVLKTGQAKLTPVTVQGADGSPDQMVISAGEHAAALYYKTEGRIQVVTGLPSAPKMTSELKLSSADTLTAMAVSDDGKTVLAGAGDRVFQATTGGEVPVLAELGQAASITIPAAGTAFVADSARNQIIRVTGIGAGIESTVLAGSKEGISSPVAVAVSSDGTRAFVANAKPGSISVIELKGEAVKTMACACTPTGLNRLAGNDVFRLTEMSKGPMWTIAAGGTEARILFVPAEIAGSSQQ